MTTATASPEGGDNNTDGECEASQGKGINNHNVDPVNYQQKFDIILANQ